MVRVRVETNGILRKHAFKLPKVALKA